MAPQIEPAPSGLCTCQGTGLLDTAQAAERLGVSQRCIRGWVQGRKIVFYKIGKFVRFDPRDLEAMLEAGRHEGWPR